jgi:hypothetical protein
MRHAESGVVGLREGRWGSMGYEVWAWGNNRTREKTGEMRCREIKERKRWDSDEGREEKGERWRDRVW